MGNMCKNTLGHGKRWIGAGLLAAGVAILCAIGKRRGGRNNMGRKASFYERIGKRGIDTALSFLGLIALAPLFGLISLAIVIDDPGSVMFTQRRIGKGKTIITIHKFRTMKMSAPHDVPTHQLEHPEKYITRVGKVLRKYSLDELPQIWDIFRGRMSIIGPRPALWNQEDLVEERDRYGANDIMPGLTGLAQINGRDELEIAEKARLDGEYTKRLHGGSISGICVDARCFFGTIAGVLRGDGVVEGGTGRLDKAADMMISTVTAEEAGFDDYGYLKSFHIDGHEFRRVLITGADSYIGNRFEAYAREHYGGNFQIDALDVTGDDWRKFDFSSYDTVFHVAGIAHADVGRVSEEVKRRYYAVNTDLAVEAARKAKESGVKQFVFMSSMIVYGEAGRYGKKRVIDEHTVPGPANFYGDSKWRADKGVRELGSNVFHVAVLRAPMIYGKGSKGNYPVLARLAKILPVFPDIRNERSMLYIDNLCEFLCLLMLAGEGGVYFPQNIEYGQTSRIVQEIGKASGRRIRIMRLLNPAVRTAAFIPGRTGKLVSKAFGNMIYDQKLSLYEGIDYRRVDLYRSIRYIERNITINGRQKKIDEEKNVNIRDTFCQNKVLIVTSVASMIDQFNMSNIKLLQNMNYSVDVAANFLRGNTCTDEKIQELLLSLDKLGVDCYQIDFERDVMNMKANVIAFKQLNAVIKNRAVPMNSFRHHGIGAYVFIHCHSPIGGVIGRLTAKLNHVGTIYTAHGFHFYKDAPKKNWFIYYPVEKGLSCLTDILVTINYEDYNRAKKSFHAGRTVYIHGVGVDTKKFGYYKTDLRIRRESLGIKKNDIVLLSYTEKNANKKLNLVIESLEMLKNTDVYQKLHYIIFGDKESLDKKMLSALSSELKEHIHLLETEFQLSDIYACSDIYVSITSSRIVVLPHIEAMAAGMPIIWLNDFNDTDSKKGSSCGIIVNCDKKEIATVIYNLSDNKKRRIVTGANAREYIQKYGKKEVWDKIIGAVPDKDHINYTRTRGLIDRLELRKALGIPVSGFVILSVGELNENKNHKVIIEALSRLRDPNIYYVICGIGKKYSQYVQLIEKLGLSVNIKLVGFQKNIINYYRMADVFAFPSKREGLGLAAIEAMAAGVPLVTSFSGGIKDYSVDGVTGYTVKSYNDVNGFMDSIKKIKDNPELRLVMSRNVERISKNFDTEKVECIMWKVYRMEGSCDKRGESKSICNNSLS